MPHTTETINFQKCGCCHVQHKVQNLLFLTTWVFTMLTPSTTPVTLNVDIVQKPSTHFDKLTSNVSFLSMWRPEKPPEHMVFPSALSTCRCCSVDYVQTISVNVFIQHTCFKGIQVTWAHGQTAARSSLTADIKELVMQQTDHLHSSSLGGWPIMFPRQ